MSALLTTTMTNMRNTIEAVEAAGLADQVHCIIGGAPVTQRYADEIGADGYAADAASAVILAKRLLGVLGTADDAEDEGRSLYLRARDALQVAVREEPGTESHAEGLMEAEGLVEQARAAGYNPTHIDRPHGRDRPRKGAYSLNAVLARGSGQPQPFGVAPKQRGQIRPRQSRLAGQAQRASLADQRVVAAEEDASWSELAH